MSLRGRINQHVEDWRNQRAVLGTTSTPTPASSARPDTRDGFDLFIIIVFIWFICLIAGYVIGRYA